MLRLLLFAGYFLLPLDFFSNFLLLSQHFIQSNVMQDGQVFGEYAPDHAEEDPADVEFHGDFPSSESGDEDESSGESTDSEEPVDDADTRADDTRDADPNA